jgi:hypothetical protein
MPPPQPPTAAERAHFATVGRAMQEEKREQIARAAATLTAEGILEGFELARLSHDSPEIELQERQRATGQLGLRLRWLELQRRRP